MLAEEIVSQNRRRDAGPEFGLEIPIMTKDSGVEEKLVTEWQSGKNRERDYDDVGDLNEK